MHIIQILIFTTLASIWTKHSEPIDISNQCKFSDKNILSNCYWRGAWSNEELIIRDDKEFQEYGRKIAEDSPKCKTSTLPAIDFSKYSLVSKLTTGSCCRDIYERRVLLDSTLKKVIYVISVEYYGLCEQLCENFNWVLVPSIPEDYIIDFKVISKT